MTGSIRSSVPRRALLAAAAIASAAVLAVPGTASAGGNGVLEVAPYEAVEIDDQHLMALLPEGRQNYVVSHPDYFTESLEQARQQVGAGIRPDSISVGTQRVDGETILVHGAWRLDERPSEIVIVPEGVEGWGYVAQPVTLEGDPGWGAYYASADTFGGDLPESFTVVAYDQDHEPFDEIEVTPWP
ncbi:hypothetical protein [Streptomyces sp. NPDC127098]|uniref:hypothetical protein n=1 Tax=Streptomyces sp. NPDC127098 TaxID=3347137 RepID=UPI003651EB26